MLLRHRERAKQAWQNKRSAVSLENKRSAVSLVIYTKKEKKWIATIRGIALCDSVIRLAMMGWGVVDYYKSANANSRNDKGYEFNEII